MYLTNVASQKKKPPLSSRSMHGGSSAGRPPLRRSMSVSTGSYRNFVHGDAAGGGSTDVGGSSQRSKRHDAHGDSTVSTAGMSDADWDPFTENKSSFDEVFLEEESESSFAEEEEEEEEEESRTSSRRRKPREQKRVGRLGNRKTRSRADPNARSSRRPSENDDEEQDDGFSVTYVAKKDSGRDGDSEMLPRTSARRSKPPPSRTKTDPNARSSRRSTKQPEVGEDASENDDEEQDDGFSITYVAKKDSGRDGDSEMLPRTSAHRSKPPPSRTNSRQSPLTKSRQTSLTKSRQTSLTRSRQPSLRSSRRESRRNILES